MRSGRSDRAWRRIAIAAPLSLVAHFLVLMATRPEYREVSDVAVDLDVIEAKPGPPAKAPEPQPPEPPPAPVAPPPETSAAAAPEAISAKKPAVEDAGVPPPAVDADAGPREALAQADVDAGTGEGGVCLHDLFPFAPADPSWLAWVSMASFRGTRFEDGFARLLSAFTMYREMAGPTGLDPGKDVEGFLVTADPFDDASSYRVIATYDSGQSSLLRALERSSSGQAGYSMSENPGGYEAAIAGKYRWHLVGKGRALVVTPEGEAAPSGQDAKGGRSEWPKDVTCLVPAERPKKGRDGTLPLALLARSMLGPDKGGHWPALVVATRDPRAIGLSRGRGLSAKFVWAYAEIRFSEPMRADGAILLSGTEEQIAATAEGFRASVAAAKSDPFLALAGLSGVLEELEIETEGDRVRFSIPLTNRQIQAALIMLEMQAGAVDEQIRRKSELNR